MLVMDEPTASLDFGNRARVLAQIDALRASGVGIILSTHDPDQTFAHGTHVALLHGGRLLACGAPDEVVTATALRQVYGIDVEILTAKRRDGADIRVCVPRS
jgi:iron complex transport system ATP-binding protein